VTEREQIRPARQDEKIAITFIPEKLTEEA
jgi:hypothetical protein